MNTRVMMMAAGVLAATGMASAQFTTGFDPPKYVGDADGETVIGQDGFYLPAVGGVGGNVYTYAGNSLGVRDNPAGGDQFMAGIGAGATFSRSQRDLCFAKGGEWIASTDILVQYGGVLPATDNVGSLSLQDSVIAKHFIMLARWQNVATADQWKADFVYFTAAGVSTTASLPDAAFQMLPVNKWYHWTTRWNFNTNRILEITLEDLETGDVFSYAPPDWYLFGGEFSVAPLPTGIRMFTGGTIAGNTMVWDNVNIRPTCFADCNNDGAVNIFDFLCFQGLVTSGSCAADCNGDGSVNIFDFLCFQGQVTAGC